MGKYMIYTLNVQRDPSLFPLLGVSLETENLHLFLYLKILHVPGVTKALRS